MPTLTTFHKQSLTADVVTALARTTEAAVASLSPKTIGNRGCCFTFHRATPAIDWPDQPNRGFHIDLSYLEGLITHLQRTGWDIVTLSEALRRSAERGTGRFVNFSVDDCYRDTADLVVPLFRRLNAPVTLFVTTGIPDRLFRLRDAGLETILQTEKACCVEGQTYRLETSAQKRLAYMAINARWETSPDPDERYAQFCRQHGHDPDVLDDLHRITWPMLKAIADDPLVEIGGHTVMHSRISALSESEAMAEIEGCRDRLREKLGRAVRHFAFPYGRAGDCGMREFAFARRAGFDSASTTRKGLLFNDTDPFRLPRNTLNGSHRRLALAYAHLTGASGLAARVMHRD